MSHTVIIRGDIQRQLAHRLIDKAPLGYVVRIAEQRRSGEQNDKMHAMLSDIARAKPLGRKHTCDEWKVILMHELDREMEFGFDLRGKPFPLGYRSSRMTKAQMSDFIEYLYTFGAENGIEWSDTKDHAA